MIFRLLFIVLFCCVLTPSCQKRSVKLDRSTMRMIDTAAATQFSELRPVLDSICAAQFDSLISVAMDSIMTIRQKEIDQILKK